MAFSLDDYVPVDERLAELKEKHPNASLQPADLEHPYRIETIGEQTFIVYVAACYREPDDPRPGIGSAWEPFPGKTSYTRDSELQNAETSAVGRAIVFALAADTKKGGVASKDEVRNRRRDQDMAPPTEPKGRRKAKPAPEPDETQLPPGVDPDVIGEVIDTIEALTDDQKEAFHAWKAAQGFPWPWPSEACAQMMLEIARILSAETQPA